MPWVVGIDEAGYGPNLGPFVQVAVSLDLPAGDLAGWKTLGDRVRQTGTANDGRVVVDDSKKIYSQGKNFAGLAVAVPLLLPTTPAAVGELLTQISLIPIQADPWFDTNIKLPAMPLPWLTLQEAGPVRLNLVSPSEFNRMVDKAGSKGVVPAQGVADLAQAMVDQISGEEPIHFLCDKLGGRNFYGGILSQAFPEAWPVAVVESAAESRYRLLNLKRDVTISFRPRADGESIAVALASMLAKYLREVCMMQWNEYWAARVPGLKPTAGYPLDAKRFLEDITPAIEAEGWDMNTIWRKK